MTRKKWLALALAVLLAGGGLLWHYRPVTLAAFCPGFSADRMLSVGGSYTVYPDADRAMDDSVTTRGSFTFRPGDPKMEQAAALLERAVFHRDRFFDGGTMSHTIRDGDVSLSLDLLYTPPNAENGDYTGVGLSLYQGSGQLFLISKDRSFSCRVGGQTWDALLGLIGAEG